MYFFVKYSNTKSLFSSQKSISKSGIEIRSGFKNLSNIRLNLIGSTSVIERHQATKDPAPDPLPGPTGISFSLAHLAIFLTAVNSPSETLAEAISILSTFNSSRSNLAIVNFSEDEKDIPDVCSPSRRVVSIISTFLTIRIN